MASPYKLVKCEPNADWNGVIEASSNGTVFSDSRFLNALECPYHLYYCTRNKEKRAAIALMIDEDGVSTIAHDYVIYNGIIYGPSTYGQNRSQVYSEQFRITEFIAGKLAEIYKNIHMQLHPSVVDVRPFLWHNYYSNGPKYGSEIRYTSYVDISEFRKMSNPEDSKLFRNASSSRRQEIRYGIKEEEYTIEEYDICKFIELYVQVMERQSLVVDERARHSILNLVEKLHDARLGRMFITKTRSGKVGSMAYFISDIKRAYYLFGVNDPTLRNAHTGTTVLWDTFSLLSKDGVDVVDLEGVNSPKRGWFKLSFGGNLVPYYKLFYLGEE